MVQCVLGLSYDYVRTDRVHIQMYDLSTMDGMNVPLLEVHTCTVRRS